mmetsp:Transcript_15588/g.49293  ORF Transcript_15588/g.49293 Transcript_15588/m.49293 type:complete len:200 (+) Transcript_15588:219-818(+)
MAPWRTNSHSAQWCRRRTSAGLCLGRRSFCTRRCWARPTSARATGPGRQSHRSRASAATACWPAPRGWTTMRRHGRCSAATRLVACPPQGPSPGRPPSKRRWAARREPGPRRAMAAQWRRATPGSSWAAACQGLGTLILPARRGHPRRPRGRRRCHRPSSARPASSASVGLWMPRSSKAVTRWPCRRPSSSLMCLGVSR